MKRLAVSAAAFLPVACLLSAWTDLPWWQYLVLGLALGVWLAVESRIDRTDQQVVLRAAVAAHMAALEERDDARAQLRRASIRPVRATTTHDDLGGTA